MGIGAAVNHTTSRKEIVAAIFFLGAAFSLPPPSHRMPENLPTTDDCVVTVISDPAFAQRFFNIVGKSLTYVNELPAKRILTLVLAASAATADAATSNSFIIPAGFSGTYLFGRT